MLVLCGVAAGDVEERALCECPRRRSSQGCLRVHKKKAAALYGAFAF